MPATQSSNGGFRAEELNRRQFQKVTARTFDVQAEAIGDLQQRVKAQGEFMADMSVRIDQHSSDIASIQGAIVILNRRADRSRWKQLRDFLLGT